MRLTLTSKQFCQIMMCILYDQLVRPDETLPILMDQDYNDLMTILKNRGLRTILQQYYMRLDPQMRVRHRFIRNVYLDNDKTKNVFIEIRKDVKPKELEEPGLIRRTGEFLSKVLTLGLYKK